MCKVKDLPLSDDGTTVLIRTLWSTKMEIKIGTKTYSLQRPRGKNELDIEEGKSYKLIKTLYGRSYRLSIKEEINEETKKKYRTKEQNISDMKEDINEFYKELEQEILKRKELKK